MMKIKDAIDKVPGGLMLIPLFLGALVKTFFPGAPSFFDKTFTAGMLTGVVPILAVWFFCMGTSIRLSATGTVLRKSGTIVLTKLVAAAVITWTAAVFIPAEGIQSGFFAGLSVLAIVCAMDMTNGGLYASLMQTYGTKEEAGAFVLTSVESGPLMSMVILGAAGFHFEWQMYLGALLPFAAGFILGNLDPKLREFFAPGGMLMIPFFAFALGNTINLGTLFSPLALLGIVLAVSVIILTGIPLILADKYIGGGTGTAGLAASSTAGAAVSNPILIAGMAPQFKVVQPDATVLVAICVIVTSILVPILTGLYYKKFGKGKAEKKEQGLNPSLAGH